MHKWISYLVFYSCLMSNVHTEHSHICNELLWVYGQYSLIHHNILWTVKGNKVYNVLYTVIVHKCTFDAWKNDYATNDSEKKKHVYKISTMFLLTAQGKEHVNKKCEW